MAPEGSFHKASCAVRVGRVLRPEGWGLVDASCILGCFHWAPRAGLDGRSHFCPTSELSGQLQGAVGDKGHGLLSGSPSFVLPLPAQPVCRALVLPTPWLEFWGSSHPSSPLLGLEAVKQSPRAACQGNEKFDISRPRMPVWQRLHKSGLNIARASAVRVCSSSVGTSGFYSSDQAGLQQSLPRLPFS